MDGSVYCARYNALRNQVEAIAALARTIRPDRVQLNTAVRPTAKQNVPSLSESQLAFPGRMLYTGGRSHCAFCAWPRVLAICR